MVAVCRIAHRGVSVALCTWLEHRSAESENLRFDSLWGLIIFPLSHARDETKKHLPLGYPIVLSIPREFLSFNTLLIFARTPIQRVLPEGSSTIRFV